MRWRQVIGLWLVLGALTLVYVRTSPLPESGAGPARRPRLLTVAPAGVRELVIERAGRTIRATRTGARWTVVEPPDAPIPDRSGGGVRRRAPRGGGDRACGRGGCRRRRVRARRGRGAGRAAHGRPASEVVLLGTPNASGTAIYARREGVPAVVPHRTQHPLLRGPDLPGAPGGPRAGRGAGRRVRPIRH